MKIWFQNRRMKWKRSKKAQQEAKAKAAEDRKAKQNRTNNINGGKECNQINNNSSPHHMLSKMDAERQDESDDEHDDDANLSDDDDDIPISSDQEEEEIDVGMSESNPHLSALVSKAAGLNMPPCSAPLPLTPQPLQLGGLNPSMPPNALGHLPPPPSLLLRGAAPNYGMSTNTPMNDTSDNHHTTLSSLLTPAHLARLSSSSRLYRPFVA